MENYNHIEEAIRLYDKIVATNETLTAKVKANELTHAEKANQMTAMMLEMCHLHLTKFPDPSNIKDSSQSKHGDNTDLFDKECNAVKLMFPCRKDNRSLADTVNYLNQFKEIPPVILQQVIPIAIMALLMGTIKISWYPFNSGIIDGKEHNDIFNKWFDRYQKLILRK
jgi:hypothetical protein